MKSAGKSKDAIKADAEKQMITALVNPHWSTPEKLALTCRILFDDGHEWGLAGQITARGASESTFYTQHWGLGFDEITPKSIMLVDEDLTVIEGDGMPNPANRFHSWLYRARPDVRCIIHTHPPFISALSMLETPLAVSHMDTSVFHGDCAFLKEWPGVPVGNAEGEIISKAIGNKKAILLSHHGQLVAGRTVEEACVMALAIERAAKLQLLASASGAICELPDKLLSEAHDWLLGTKRVDGTFACYARRALRRYPDCLQ